MWNDEASRKAFEKVAAREAKMLYKYQHCGPCGCETEHYSTPDMGWWQCCNYPHRPAASTVAS